MAEVITVANHKGGCAKTVTTLNLGYALKELGYKVLLVDLDSQANLTTCSGIDYPNSIETNIAHLMISKIDEEPLPGKEKHIISKDGLNSG